MSAKNIFISFTPREDITAHELAIIINKWHIMRLTNIDASDWDVLPLSEKRHFTKVGDDRKLVKKAARKRRATA